MSIITIIVSLVLVLVTAFVVLILVGNWLSARDYKPTIAEVIQHLEDCIAGEMDRGQYDEFSSCRIVYDPRLDAIRERFNEITDDRENIEGNFSETDATALNDVGKRKIQELVNELRQLESAVE